MLTPRALCIPVALLLLSIPSLALDANLLANGGFEWDVDMNGKPDSWTAHTWGETGLDCSYAKSTHAYADTYSLALTVGAQQSGRWFCTVLSELVPVTPGIPYVATGQGETTPEGPNQEHYTYAWFYLDFYNGGTVILSADNRRTCPGYWCNLQAAEIAPLGATHARVNLTMYYGALAPNPSTIYFDAVRLIADTPGAASQE